MTGNASFAKEKGRVHVEYTLNELRDEVEILLDSDGVPHIYAENSNDAYVAQGFNIARDRLWQIDFWRRRGLGQLSEILGDEFVESDRSARLFLFRGDMDAEWASYGAQVISACTAFVAGINAFVGLTRENPLLLPPEFDALGYQPAFWERDDVVRIRNQGVYTNATDEITRAVTLRDFGPDVEQLRQNLEPSTTVQVPEGLDLEEISSEILTDYMRAVLPLTVGPRKGDLLEGSNNWVISGSRTATGRPILANDPHRDTSSLPGMRYVAHVSCPEFDIIGAGEPHLPGLSLGHNGTAAFGYTVFMTDQEDVYVYELAPDDPYLYRYQGGWRRFQEVEESILLASGERRSVQLLFSHHGPVLAHDPKTRRAFALRAAWLEPGAAPYVNSIEYMQTKTWDEFRSAISRWKTPGENLIYADIKGNIGWKPAAIIPKRENWDGLLPVPGDGRYEWAGFYGNDELPHEVNPDRGWIATANEFRMSEDDLLYDKAGFYWAPPERRERIDQILAERDSVSVESQFALQYDTMNLPAKEILGLVKTLPFVEPDTVPGLDELLAWDFRMNADSRAALVYEVWFREHLRPCLLRLHLQTLEGVKDAEAAAVHLLGQPTPLVDARHYVRLLQNPSSELGVTADVLAHRVAETLASTSAHLRELLGEESAENPWQWGTLHHALSTHPLRDRLTGILADDQLRIGPLARGGSAHTVGMSSYDNNFRQVMGATVRFVFDVGHWDQSIGMNAPGQSGDPRSQFYSHLFERWVQGESFPLRYSRQLIESATVERIVLRPSSRSAGSTVTDQ